jgi:hypothetical protein
VLRSTTRVSNVVSSSLIKPESADCSGPQPA